MARDRSDLRWQHLASKEQWRERLRWARETHGSYSRAEWFAPQAGVSAANYRKYERLPSEGRNFAKDFPYAKAVAWADKLDVRWQWLLEGEGAPWRDDEALALSAEALDLAETLDRFPEEDRRAKVAAIKALLTGT